jgi:hypothetical protein
MTKYTPLPESSSKFSDSFGQESGSSNQPTNRQVMQEKIAQDVQIH